MQLVDETTDRSAGRPLPVPSGPRAPTGRVPLTKPATATPPPELAAPILPYLPSVAPKVTAPVTGSVATTMTAAALHFQELGLASTAAAPPAKRRHKRLIVLGVLVAVALLLAVIFRNSPVVDEIDPHHIPMIDDIMGFELRALPPKPPAQPASSDPKSGRLPESR
jgi:hypothetical protein